MEPITGNNLKIVTDCITFARQFLFLPDKIDVYFDDCPSARFPTIVNAAESNSHELFFNKPWFLQRIYEHRDDLEFFIFHELRHMHQQSSIVRKACGCQCIDEPEIIDLWEQGFKRYVRNVGGESQSLNVAQEIEIDANAYAICLVNLLHIDDNLELHFSMPDEAAKLADPRAQQYVNTRREFRNYINAYQLRKRQVRPDTQGISPSAKSIPIRKKWNVSANDPCPCGSGKKFKRCCRGKGIYD